MKPLRHGAFASLAFFLLVAAFSLPAHAQLSTCYPIGPLTPTYAGCNPLTKELKSFTSAVLPAGFTSDLMQCISQPAGTLEMPLSTGIATNPKYSGGYWSPGREIADVCAGGSGEAITTISILEGNVGLWTFIDSSLTSVKMTNGRRVFVRPGDYYFYNTREMSYRQADGGNVYYARSISCRILAMNDRNATIYCKMSVEGCPVRYTDLSVTLAAYFTDSYMKTTCVQPVCGNGVCEAGETTTSCSLDCKPATVCGNGICESTETASSCAADCSVQSPPPSPPPAPAPGPVCGNLICEAGETSFSCWPDCFLAPPPEPEPVPQPVPEPQPEPVPQPQPECVLNTVIKGTCPSGVQYDRQRCVLINGIPRLQNVTYSQDPCTQGQPVPTPEPQPEPQPQPSPQPDPAPQPVSQAHPIVKAIQNFFSWLGSIFGFR